MKSQVDEDQELAGVTTESESQLPGQPTHQWAFDIEDRGYRVRASYQDELGNNVEIYRGERLIRTLTYEGYRIWNIAAHFHDYVDQFIAEQNALWRTAYTLVTNADASSGATQPD